MYRKNQYTQDLVLSWFQAPLGGLRTYPLWIQGTTVLLILVFLHPVCAWYGL